MSSGNADSVGGLVAQRQALEAQKAALSPEVAAQLTEIAAAEDALNNLQAELGHNAGILADLGVQQANLRTRIDDTTVQISTQRKLLATLTRGQYKAGSKDGTLSVLFEATSFSQLVNRMMAANRVSRNISDTAKKLKQDEASLRSDSDALLVKQVAAASLEQKLQAENGREMAIKAAHDAALAGLTASARGYAAQIAQVNRQIAIALTPPAAPRFSSGGGSAGGRASCGNHFSFGYCTWYVANRRCIPWFGNADEWWANARASGYPEGQQAKVGAVAVWAAGPGYGGVGHVAYVESVQPDGFTVSEYNYTYGWDHYDTRFVSYGKTGPLDGFIYGN